MKMIFLSYKESINDEVMEIAKQAGIKSFTRWSQVQDQGESGYPKMGTHIWPGYNSVLTFVAEDTVAKDLMHDIRSFNQEREFEGIKAMCWTLDDYCWK